MFGGVLVGKNYFTGCKKVFCSTKRGEFEGKGVKSSSTGGSGWVQRGGGPGPPRRAPGGGGWGFQSGHGLFDGDVIPSTSFLSPRRL